MKFGHFDDQKREYLITNPRTPYPWITSSIDQLEGELVPICQEGSVNNVQVILGT